jgi:hypothetical protein
MNAVALQIVEPVAGLPALVMQAASRLASAAGHNPETGGAPSFNNCRRAVVARRAALGDAQGMSPGPGAANNSVVAGGRRQTALRLVSRPRFVTHRGPIDLRGLTGSVADAAIGTMLRQVAYKADWRGRKLVAADKWFASTKTCCRCGERHAMPLSQRTMRCACGNVMDRDENAAVNLYWYGEEPRNRALLGATRVETGCQAAGVSLLPVPVVETRMLAVMEHASDHECQ